MAKDVVAAPVASAGRPTLTIEQLKPLEYCNLVCQVSISVFSCSRARI